MPLAPGEYLTVEVPVSRHDRCGDHLTLVARDGSDEDVRFCQLRFLHNGPHADVSLSGLVLMTWPNNGDEEDHL